MSSKNVFKKLFKKKTDRNKAREGGTGNNAAGNLDAQLTMESFTNLIENVPATNSEQASIVGHEAMATDKHNVLGDKAVQDDGGSTKKGMLTSSPTATTLVDDGAQTQVIGQSVSRWKATAYEAVKETLRAVVRCSDAFPPLKSAGQAILEIIERYDAVKEIPKELGLLNEKLRLLIEILESGTRDVEDDRLNGLARTFEEKSKLIALKLDRSMAARIVETSQDRAFIAHEISSITFAIEIAMLDVNLRTNKGVKQLQETVAELKVLALLDKLKYVEGAGFNHEDRQGCTNGTRIMLLGDLLAWATDPAQHHVFWLNGMAGTGKTTVAETLCNLLAGRGHLGSSFFCSRKTSERRNVRLIFPALAKGLARRYPEFRNALVEVLKDDLDFTGMGLDDQFLTLILEPAEKAFAQTSEPVIIAVDALDECEDSQAAELFLKAILRREPSCFLRFFVTSRPEPKIQKGFASGIYSTLRLQDIEQHIVNADIAIFLNHKLKEIEDLYEAYSDTWPPPEVNVIVNQSGNLFIYAATAAKYIADEHGDPVERLSKFASITPPANAVETIDEVYSFILAEAFSKKLDAQEKKRIKACLVILTCAFEPLAVNTYAVLLGISPLQVRRAFASLHSVVQVPENRMDQEVILLYHASFPDYLNSPDRSASQPWLLDVRLGHLDMANYLLDILIAKLHFNISGATTSYKSNIEQNLTVPVFWQYISLSWAKHALYSSPLPRQVPLEILDKTESFLRTNFLYWLEVLSVLGRVERASNILLSLSRATRGTQLNKMLQEFSGFAATFLLPIQTSAPHIYHSALAWALPSSIIGTLYLPKYSRGLAKIHDSTSVYTEEDLILQLLGHTGAVTSVQFSPDGEHIVTGSKDRSICIWNTHTGDLVSKPLKAHTAAVNAVCYSPDGRYIVSGSKDACIKFWDPAKGSEITSISTTSEVLCLAFSAKSDLLASGASTGIISVWNIGNNKAYLLKEIQGHQEYVGAVAFSSDGQYIASGSGDWTVGIWKVDTGTPLVGCLKGHTDVVTCVAFSNDNQRVISGSEDNLIFVWTLSGQKQYALKGHTNRVTSLDLSKDGILISGSQDKTARMWDTETYHTSRFAKVLHGHTSDVTSVALSPNTQLAASGSLDKSVKLWNAATFALDISENSSHSDYITSVAFSPDGEHIASGSRDNTIIIWNKHSGKLISQHAVHSERVACIAYSSSGQYIASGSRDRSIIIQTAIEPHSIVKRLYGHQGFVHRISFFGNDQYIASASADHTIRLWDITLPENAEKFCETLYGHTDQVSSLVVSVDSKVIVSGSVDKTVCLWNIASRKQEVLKLPDICLSVAISNNGEYLAAGLLNSSTIIWNANSKEKLYVITGIHTDQVSTIAFSPDSKYLACGSRDATISIWDLQGQKLKFPVLQGHTGHVTSVAFSSNGDSLLSGGHDNQVRMWNTCLPYDRKLDNAQATHLHNFSAGQYLSNKSGWIQDCDKNLILWVPPGKQSLLYMPQTQFICGDGKIRVDMIHAGSQWAMCSIEG